MEPSIYTSRVWRERWIGWRNRLLASPRFQALALATPPMRPIARRHARRLFDLVAGFTYSQTLLAGIEFGLFERLAAGPVALDAFARDAGLSRAAAERLIAAAAALGLVDRLSGGRVALGPAGAALAANPGVAAMIAHHRGLYTDLADPVALLRRDGGGGGIDRFWDYRRDSRPEAVAAYSRLMAASQPPVAAQLLAAYPVARHRRLLDVGGGEGAFLAAVAAAAPALELGLFDLPAVGARAAARLGVRVAVHGGDFLVDPLPDDYDLITLVRVVHDHDDEAASALLARVRAALPPGGRLLIGEPMTGRGEDAMSAAYFGLYLLAMGRGRARSPAEIGALLDRAGFSGWRLLRTQLPLVTSAIVARR